MEIKRDSYLQQLISYRFDGLVKVITGIRRCGKSYLLMNLYKDYLLRSGVKEDQIIVIQLDLAKDIRYRNPLELSSYVRSMVEGKSEESIYSLMKSRCRIRLRILIAHPERRSLFTMR